MKKIFNTAFFFLFGIMLLLSKYGAAQTAYVPNFYDDNLFVIDLATKQITDTVLIGDGPNGIAFSPDGSKVYIANSTGDSLAIINTSDNSIETSFGVGNGPSAIALTPDGSKIYVTHAFSDDVYVINAATYVVMDTIQNIDFAYGVAVSKDGSRVYVTSRTEGYVAVIDVSADTIVSNITVGDGPLAIRLNPDGTQLYVTNGISHDVSVIDVATETVIDTIPVDNNPIEIAFLPNGSKVYVASSLNGNLNVIDAVTNSVEATITGAASLFGVDVSPDGSKVYTLDFDAGKIHIIDAATNMITESIDVGEGPIAVGSFILNTTPTIPGNECVDANNIDDLFGQAQGESQISALWDNSSYTSVNDPADADDCHADSDPLQNTIWYSFTSPDGATYAIETIECNATNYIDFGDTQMTIYIGGDCGSLIQVACNDDEDLNNDLFNAYLELPTDPGTTYYILIDGYDGSDGEFCLEVTSLAPNEVTSIKETDIKVFPNPTTGMIQLENNEVNDVQVFDSMSRLVLSVEQPGSNLDISHLSAGIYFLKIRAEEGVYSARVVKE